jgi:large subunit ribosomal protein L10
MPTEAKQATVAELRSELERNPTMIVSEYRGLTVKEIAEIRRALRKQDVTYRVVKNRLLKIAAEGGTREALDPLLTGPTAIAFGSDEAGTAKAVIDALRPYRVVRITGGVLGDRRIEADDVQRLASLPSRETLLAQVIGAIAAPLSTTAGLFEAPLRDVAGLAQALADQRSAAPAA